MGIGKEGWKDSPQNFNFGYLWVKRLQMIFFLHPSFGLSVLKIFFCSEEVSLVYKKKSIRLMHYLRQQQSEGQT